MSKATNILGTKIINATAKGNKFSQHKSINWSYRVRSKVARINTNKKQNRQVLIPKIIA
jgi:hypothetical protein